MTLNKKWPSNWSDEMKLNDAIQRALIAREKMGYLHKATAVIETLRANPDLVMSVLSLELELQAQLMEYEHALEHATEHHDGPVCPDCQSLCQSALDGVNREGFLDILRNP